MSNENQEQSEIPNGNPTTEETPIVSPEIVEAPASDISTTTHEPAIVPTERQRVSGVSDYEKRLKEALQPVSAAPEPEVGEIPPTEEVTPETPEETEIAPTEEVTPPVEGKKEFRPRLSSLDARQQEAILLAKEFKEKGQDISLGEAERRVNAKYGIVDSEKPTQADVPPARTMEIIDAEIAEKMAAAKQAAEDLDVARALELQQEAFDLKDEKRQIKAEQSVKSTQAETKFGQDVEASRQRALEVYPVAAQEGHTLHAKATEIWESMQEHGNPLIFDANAPFKVYQMAANELGIAPNSKTASPAVKSLPSATPRPQAVQQSAVRSQKNAIPVASGGDRTTQTGPASTESIGKIRTAHDYAETVRKLGVSSV